MITHQILITFDSARDFRDRQFANSDSTQMYWFLVRKKMCWWLIAEAGGFAERIRILANRRLKGVRPLNRHAKKMVAIFVI